MGLRGVGVFLPTFAGAGGRTGEELAAFARRAEDLGFDSVWATDHLLHQSRFYAVPWLDPIVSLTYVAAATSRLRLGTSVLVLPTRQPVVLAKQIATLQALADERYILGVGTGWDDREFQAVGQRRAERGGRTDESITILRGLLAGEPVTYEGRYYQLRDVAVGPVRTGWRTREFDPWIGPRRSGDPFDPEVVQRRLAEERVVLPLATARPPAAAGNSAGT